MTELYLTDVSQVESELVGLINVLVEENVTRFLEVGSRFGGSLWRIATALPPGSTIVSCDSGSGMGGKKNGQMQSLERCIDALIERGYDAHLVVGDSQLPHVVENVKKWAPFDAVFIDADHEFQGVSRDWQNYGPLTRITAFHDVGWVRPENYMNSKVVRVPELWQELKHNFNHREFIDYSTGRTMGIGVLWR